VDAAVKALFLDSAFLAQLSTTLTVSPLILLITAFAHYEEFRNSP